MAQMTSGTVRFRERLDGVRARIPSTQATPVATLTTADNVDAAWDVMTVESRRKVVGLLHDRGGPGWQGARTFKPEMVRLLWKSQGCNHGGQRLNSHP